MFLKIMLIAVLAVLYGLAWHNEPTKAERARRHDNDCDQKLS